MKESKAVFENEDAIRLLEYFIHYKELVNRNDVHPAPAVDEVITKLPSI